MKTPPVVKPSKAPTPAPPIAKKFLSKPVQFRHFRGGK